VIGDTARCDGDGRSARPTGAACVRASETDFYRLGRAAGATSQAASPDTGRADGDARRGGGASAADLPMRRCHCEVRSDARPCHLQAPA